MIIFWDTTLLINHGLINHEFTLQDTWFKHACAFGGKDIYLDQCLKLSPPLSGGTTQNWRSWIGRKGLEWPMCSQMAVPLLARCFGVQRGQ